MESKKIAYKIKKSLRIIFYILLVISFRLWHLTVIKKEDKLKEAKKPKEKTILKKATRGSIYDRYGIKITQNCIEYSACVYYSQIRQLPTYIWKKKENKKYKYYVRKAYIKKLAILLSQELSLDPERVEDLIHSKASLIPHVPFAIKKNISEKEYYKLRALEKDFLGLNARIDHKRLYPFKKVGCDILGYLGSIDRKKYLKIASEIKELKKIVTSKKNNENPILPDLYKNFEEIEKRLSYLKEKAYKIDDLIGKNGLELQYDEIMRGFHGNQTFLVDVKGSFLKEIKNKDPIPGKDIQTTISKELQEFAEFLLLESEKLRDGVSKGYDSSKKMSIEKPQPLIKGGSIVVMDPNSGEILALASSPRFDPNDFIDKKEKKIVNWIELERHIENIWNNKTKLTKETYSFYQNKLVEEKKELSLDLFLEYLLTKKSPVYFAFKKIKKIKTAITIQEAVEAIAYLTKQPTKESLQDIFTKDSYFLDPKIVNLKNKILPYLENLKIDEKLLIVDLCRLIVHSVTFSDDLIEKTKNIPIDIYFDISKKYLSLEKEIKKIVKPMFSNLEFKKWKKIHTKDFLKQKRKEEKEKKRYAKPYIDYLDQMENKLFNEFFEKNKHLLITSFIKDDKLAKKSQRIYQIFLKKQKKLKHLSFLKEKLKDLDFDSTYLFLKTIRPFSKLTRPLLGNYKRLKNKKNQIEKDLAKGFYPINGYGYGSSFAFRKSTPLGSIFKIVTSYAALKEKYDILSKKGIITKRINPLTMVDTYKWDKNKGAIVIGYNENNIPYPIYYRGGRLISSANKNIGKIDITSAIAYSSNPYFSLLAGDFLKDPENLKIAAYNLNIGKKTNIDLPFEFKGNLPKDLKTNKTGLYSFAIGQHTLVTTPLQTAVMLSAIANGGYILKPQIVKTKSIIKQKIEIPSSIRNTILEGMEKAIIFGTAKAENIKLLKQDIGRLEKYKSLKNQIVGKTSTAEILHKIGIAPNLPAQKYKHIWFGSILFSDSNKKWERPELVVIVFLRFGDSGKEAAPIASEVIHKYKELKKKYGF